MNDKPRLHRQRAVFACLWAIFFIQFAILLIDACTGSFDSVDELEAAKSHIHIDIDGIALIPTIVRIF